MCPRVPGGRDVLQGGPADRGGHVQQRGGRPRLQRVPRPAGPAGQAQGLPEIQGGALQQK